MATRNVSAKFDSLRSHLHRRAIPNYTMPMIDSDVDIDSEDGQSINRSINIPPEWVDITDTIHTDIQSVDESLHALSRLHAQRLKVTFGDDVIAEQEREIEILTQSITHLLKQCERNVKKIAFVENNGKLSSQERSVRLNVMRALATDIQNHSKIFRNSQKEFLQKLREQETSGSEFGFVNGASDSVLDDEGMLDQGFSDEQSQALEELNDRASEREKEIIKVAQSINELAQLFKELNVLVIESGTILDRIDYNVEQSKAKIDAGNEFLQKADEHSKKMYTLKAIICLTFIIIVLIVVLVVMKTNITKKHDDDGDK